MALLFAIDRSLSQKKTKNGKGTVAEIGLKYPYRPSHLRHLYHDTTNITSK